MKFEDAEPNPRFTGYIEDHDDMDPIYIADQLNKNNWVLLSDGVQLFDKGVINTPVNRSTYLNFIHYHIIKHPLTQREIRAVYELDRDGQLRVDRGRVVRLPCPRAADRSLMAQYDGSAYQHVVAEARRTHSLTHPAAALSPSDTNIDVDYDVEDDVDMIGTGNIGTIRDEERLWEADQIEPFSEEQEASFRRALNGEYSDDDTQSQDSGDGIIQHPLGTAGRIFSYFGKKDPALEMAKTIRAKYPQISENIAAQMAYKIVVEKEDYNRVVKLYKAGKLGLGSTNGQSQTTKSQRMNTSTAKERNRTTKRN
jgi:hypothetical protein